MKKKIYLIALILFVIALVVVVTVLYLKKNKNSEPEKKEIPIKELKYVDETIEYYEKYYDLEFEKRSDNAYRAVSKKLLVDFLFLEKDEKEIVSKIYFVKYTDVQDVFKVARPFFTRFDDLKQLERAAALAEKKRIAILIGSSAYDYEFDHHSNNPYIEVNYSYALDDLEQCSLGMLSIGEDEKMHFKENNVDVAINPVSSFGDKKLYRIWLSKSLKKINFKYYDEDNMESKVEYTFAYNNYKLNEYINDLKEHKISYEFKEVNGKKYLAYERDKKGYALVLFDGSEMDINDEEEKYYLLLEVTSSDNDVMELLPTIMESVSWN